MAHDSTHDNDLFLSSIDSTPSRSRTAQKRTASFAQLGDSELGNADIAPQEFPSRIRIKSMAFASQMEKSSLERKMLALESERKGLEVKLGMKDREIARLENDKRWLAERETEERSEKEILRTEAENERREASVALSALRSQLAAQTEELAQLQQEFSGMKRSTSQTINEQKVHLLDVTRQASQFEEEIKQLRDVLEERDEMIDTLRSELNAKDTSATFESIPQDVSDIQGWKIVQDELHRQAAYIHKIDAENIKLKSEVVTLSDRSESIQVLREERRQLENRLRSMDELRHRVVQLEGENDQLRGQLSSSSDIGQRNAMNDLLSDLEALRFRNVNLEDSLGETRAESIVLNGQLTDCHEELSHAQRRIESLEVDLEEVKSESQRLRRRVEISEGEIRFWKSAAELEQGQSKSENAVDMSEEAKKTIELLKQELEILLGEIRNLGGGVERHGKSWADLSKSLNEETRKRVQAEEGLSATQTQCSTLLDKNEGLEQTLFELRGDIASGSHLPPNTRVLCLKENPFQQWVDTREEVVNLLKKENEALLSRLAALGANGEERTRGETDMSMDMTIVDAPAPAPASGTVPRESWEVEHAEKLALKAELQQMGKRLLRLQQIFKAKAQEFKDTISSILGYKFHFSGNGQVRLTSQYDVNTSFVFQSSSTTTEDGSGKVNLQLVGAGESSLDDLPRTVAFWVEKRGSIPALMATVTLECFDKVWRARREEAGDEIF